MEDGLGGPLCSAQLSDHMRNGISPKMANFPEGTVTEAKNENKSTEPPKINGENSQESEDTQNSIYQDSYSSESDALVIDESVPKKRKVKGKYNKKSKEIGQCTSEKENEVNSGDLKEKVNSDKSEFAKDCCINDKVTNPIVESTCGDTTQTINTFNSDALEHVDSKTYNDCDHSRLDIDVNSARELLTHSNPYFNESLFELSQLHQVSDETSGSSAGNLPGNRNTSSNFNRIIKRVKQKPKLKEYAQYLGLQPAVQFKCPKCGKSGFESLITLQDHFLQCNAVQNLEKATENENISGFKLTRKVFLCSACGTYYENWNLYMHMLEYHRRYICLYCLGMFSVLDDLCQHIQSRHNLEPGVKNTLEDFYNAYSEPCYVVCCECNRQFNERENFFYHSCTPAKSVKSKAKPSKQVIAPENHVTGDSAVTSNNSEVVTEKENSDSEQNCAKGSSPMLFLEERNDSQNSEEEGVSQVDSGKQNLNDNETSKHCVSDCSENAEDSSSIMNKEAFAKENSPDNILNSEVDAGYVKELSPEHAQLDCEQDSLDSVKNSDKNLDNFPSTDNTMEDIEDNLSNCGELDELVETRKVPKLSLKLPKSVSYLETIPEDSDGSEKHAVEIDNIESENENEHEHELSDAEPTKEEPNSEEKTVKPFEQFYPVAGSDVPIIELELDQPLDKMDIRILLQKCLRATGATCIYCNHSRRIAVNGMQLGLHAMAEHRYSAINKSITAEELIPESFNSRIKECLEELQTVFFNLDSGTSDEAVTFSHVFECFQCHYSTTVHKELYLHNRKFHSKNLLLCIMCKSNFYSYSELICHLCPGVYVLDCDLQFRCCMCVSDDLPSSFRLMVHLRKRHNVCDVCLEMCHSQYKLSNHVWKHKLHHFCYRCGIAYRNKPDITRHLFWKHGTESVLCKKCLQKKWPHVYHFCVPPATFTCEECNLIFTRAVSLKVHKRIHTDEKKHSCTWEECTESFISKKLMLKHLKRHTESPEEDIEEKIQEEEMNKEQEGNKEQTDQEQMKETEEPPKLVKPKVDVYDLPELNLSESDTSDSEAETEQSPEEKLLENKEQSVSNEEKKPLVDDNLLTSDMQNIDQAPPEEKSDDFPQQPFLDDTSSTVMQNIWDNFKNYQANKEKLDNMFTNETDTKPEPLYVPDIPIPIVEEPMTWQMALRDHDYCAEPEVNQTSGAIIEVKPALECTQRVDHDYCFQTDKVKMEPEKPKGPAEPVKEVPLQEEMKKSPLRKRPSSSSSSSSDSDSNSSCACDSSCSCSDSSSNSSSCSSDSSNSDSSTEEGIKRQQQRRLKRKERNKANRKEAPNDSNVKVDVISSNRPLAMAEMPLRESDLETTESETDEEFYDKEPQKFAKKILEEKRAQFLAEMGPNMVPNGSFIESTSRPPSPPAGTVEEEDQPKRKKKTKKRKKKKNEKRDLEQRSYSATLIIDPEPGSQITPPFYQQFHQMDRQSPTVTPITLSLQRNSPVLAPQTPPQVTSLQETPLLSRQDSIASDSSLRASKRRRVPNKFYGYSSDEDADKPNIKRSKIEINKTIPAPSSPMLVPPITIKTGSSPAALPPRPPVVEPITLRLPRLAHPSTDFRVQRKPSIPPIKLMQPRFPLTSSKEESGTESNDSDLDEPPQPIVEEAKPPQPQLYCYCRCPYDEVSEMIGCDSSDCQIEWFHFECVGIMVPPKGQWFCPDCRKKKQQQRRDLFP